ncbi:MAG: methyltransferase domain-containing protein [Acidothermaceae bacterium]
MSRSKFDSVAAEYDAGRPGYPDELFDAIEQLSGGFLSGARVADIGAGTGKSTRALLDRGATVVAADHGANMLAVLQSRSPEVPVVLADANELPFADNSFDLVTFAQSWHWVDLAKAPAEVARVTRPGGAVAMWWNTSDPAADTWLLQHRARLEALGSNEVGSMLGEVWSALHSAFAEFEIETTQLRWHRIVDKAVVLDEVRSKSYVVALGDAGARDLVEEERRLLPDGELCESFLTRLAVVRIPVAARNQISTPA